MTTAIASRGTLRLMSRKGDTAIRWNADDPKSVERARQEFDQFARIGCSFFGRRARSRKTTQIRQFDPNLAEILVVPQLAGGGES